MSREMRFTFIACSDLNEIWESIALPPNMWGSSDPRRLSSAEGFAAGLAKHCELLTQHPEAGAERSGLPPGIRSTRFQKYAIFYRTRGDVTDVLRVLPAIRDVDTAE